MLIFTIVVLACAVIGLVIAQCVLSSQIDELEIEVSNDVSSEYFENVKESQNKKIRELQEVNAEIFTIIAKEFGKEFNKVRLLENAGKWNEKVVTKFELVKASKAKK